MPCQYYGPGEEHAEYSRQLDKLTRMLCSLVKKVEAHNENAQLMDIIRLGNELGAWWREHQESDRQREAAKKESKEREERIEREQLAKLKAKYPDA